MSSNSPGVRISRTYLQVSAFVKCQFQLVTMAGSGWLSFHCSGTLECNFITIFQYHAALLACGSLRLRILFPRPHLAHGPCVPSSSRPFLCHTLRVCCIFFHPFRSPECYPLLRLSMLQNSKFGGLFRLRGLCKGSGHSGLSIDWEQNVCISCSTAIYRLTNLAPFWFFFGLR